MWVPGALVSHTPLQHTPQGILQRWFQLGKLTCSWTPVCLLRAQSQGEASSVPSLPLSLSLSALFCRLARTAVCRDRVTMRVISTRRRSKFAASCVAAAAAAAALPLPLLSCLSVLPVSVAVAVALPHAPGTGGRQH